ncbi:hypothetical protein HPB51_007466 [Rhipicephalus microplus]|uniref:Uncharacterized protein n=1 Tax=Rhipicephalus microplus TaxID=6941 RepID=A0A9J6EYR7_RHIMP|nr:hypothetical protein HPB51_007466 [Rhipicephalus microplus]
MGMCEKSPPTPFTYPFPRGVGDCPPQLLITRVSTGSDAGAITWSNTFEDLGSDHRVLCMTMGDDEGKMDGCQKARVVDWDKFREHREREKQNGLIEDIRTGCRELLANVKTATKEIEWPDRLKEPEDGQTG